MHYFKIRFILQILLKGKVLQSLKHVLYIIFKYIYFYVIKSTLANTFEAEEYKEVISSTNREKREQEMTKIDFQFKSIINLNHTFLSSPTANFSVSQKITCPLG